MTLDLYGADKPSAVMEAAMATKITAALKMISTEARSVRRSGSASVACSTRSI
jgi:hypothetical protein